MTAAAQSAHRAPARAIPGPCRRRRQRRAHVAPDRPHVDRRRPAATAMEFLASLRAGLGRPGGRHGGAAVVAGDAYGVVARYCASVLGWGPRDHRGWHRAACAACIAASLPFQFLPGLVPLVGKRRERQTVAAAAATLEAWARPRASRAARGTRAMSGQGRHHRDRARDGPRHIPRRDVGQSRARRVRHSTAVAVRQGRLSQPDRR